jgi:transcriptional regulator with XRE-family HTH domain
VRDLSSVTLRATDLHREAVQFLDSVTEMATLSPANPVDSPAPCREPDVVPVADGTALAQFPPARSVELGKAQNAPSVAAEADGAAFGQFLRRARERAGLTLKQISNETKIPDRHLEALEQGNLTAIPGGFYGRAEIRAYAEMVHLDQSLALARFERVLAPATREAISETQLGEAPASSKVRTRTALGVVIVAVLFGFAAWDRTPAPESRVRAPSAADTQKPPRPQPADQLPPSPFVGSSQPVPIDHATTPSLVSEDDLIRERNSDGELIVTTEPAGGRVTVNDIGWGKTPVTIRYLPLGPKRIRVTKDGYEAEERLVRLSSNRPMVRLQIPLRAY